MRIIPSIEFIPGKSNVGSALSVIGPDFTFSRTTTPVAGVATRVNASGLIETVPDNVLRLDYPVTGGCPAALIEPSAQNLLLRSEEFTTTWSSFNGTASTGTTAAFTAPDGTTNADLFTESTDVLASNHQISQSISTAVVSGTSYTLSCFIKATAANRSARLALSSTLFSGSPQAFFDVTNGVVGQATDCTSRIDNYGNGWYRCSITAICDVSGTASVFISSASGNTRDYIGNGSASLYLWGAQLETGAIPTSYIPTTTASATRNADVCSVSGVSGYIGQTQGTIYAEVDIRAISVFRDLLAISLNSNTTDFASIQISDSNFFRARMRSGTGALFDITASSVISGIVKIAMAYDANGTILYVNGNLIGTNASGAPNWVSGVNFIHIANGPQSSSGSGQDRFLNDRIRAAAIYTTRLSNATLESMTSLSQSYAELASSFSYTVI